MEHTLPFFDDQDCDVNCFDFQESRTRFSYSKEKKGVEDFVTDIGFERSAESVLRLVRELKSRYKTIILIGFGVGATTAWLCSEDEDVDGVLGFCGSGIENFLDILPACTALLLYRKKESVCFADKLSEFRNLRVEFFDEGVDYDDILALRNTQGPGECVYYQIALFINMVKGRAL